MKSQVSFLFIHQAVQEEGLNPDEFYFDISEKKSGKKSNTGSKFY